MAQDRKDRGSAGAQKAPLEEYTSRLEQRHSVSGRLERRHIAIGNVRLAIAISGVLIGWLSLGRHHISALWLLIPVALFAALAIVHERVLRAKRRADRGAAFYQRGLDRLNGTWQGVGEGGERFDDPHHPYAEDLDLFGQGSLFQLLSTARLLSGEEALARWLLQPAGAEEIRGRQQAIEELRPRLALREEVALLGEDIRSGVHPGGLARWAEQPLVFDSPMLRILAFSLAFLAAAGSAVWAIFNVPSFFVAVVVCEAFLFFRLRGRMNAIIETVGEPAYGLDLLAHILGRIERERFQCPRLVQLREQLRVRGVLPSRSIARLNRLMELLDSSHHWLMRIIGPPLLFREQIVFAIEAWRKRFGPYVRKWLIVAGEFEAFCALSAYAYEHPDDCFPEFASGEACFDGEALGHPLLGEKAVRNDVLLCGERRVLVVSGSNMSGKSTLLRTIGINTVLAMAGSPVRARKLRLTPLTVGASIRTLDSLQSGTSRFYTEITRIRQLVDLTDREPPLLFLLDELLQGTNSHDRRIGAEAIIRELVERKAIGLLTTHDLALTIIADVLAPRAANVHFQDELDGGRIHFDYKLRPGVVTKSNALELMRSVGLDV